MKSIQHGGQLAKILYIIYIDILPEGPEMVKGLKRILKW